MENKTELKKTLGYTGIIALALTSLIGTGMFFGVGIAASYAGPASILSWVILAAISIYVSACFGELSSLFPKAGGVYEFSKQAYSRFTSFLVGWVTWLVSNITSALLIVAAIEYLSVILAPVFPAFSLLKFKLLFIFVLILLLNSVTYFGVRLSSILLTVFAFLSLILILAILTAGSIKIVPSNYSPFFTKKPIMIFLALFYIMETFFGWESVTFLAEETKEPRKIIPRSLLVSTIIITVLGVLLATVLIGAVPLNLLASSTESLKNVANILFGTYGNLIMGIGIFLTFIGSAAGGIVSTPRLLLALARDKLFIEQLSDIHPKYKTPYKAVIFQTIVTLVIAFITLGNYLFLLSMLVPLALLMYIFVLFAIPILRKKIKEKRTFKAWFGKTGPFLVIILYLLIIISWILTQKQALQQTITLILLILLGIPIYMLLSFYYDPKWASKSLSFFPRLSYKFENFAIPRRIRDEVVMLFPDISGKTIAEIGSGVGTLTLPLAFRVGTKGEVYAVDGSEKNIKILKKRLKKHKLDNIRIIQDPHMLSRIHPDLPNLDAVFSFGTLSYIQNIEQVLKGLAEKITKEGKICFVEYLDMFKIIPNPPILRDKNALKELFGKYGFSVQIKRIKGTLWDYLLIYGIKSGKKITYA